MLRRTRLRATEAVLALALSTSLPCAALAEEGPPAPAAATGDANVARLNEEGAELYRAGEYRRAAEKFIEAYAVDHDVNLLFNIARCYEEIGDTAAAIEKYRAFLAAKEIDAEGRARAEASLAKLEAKASAAAAPPTAPPRASEPVAPPPSAGRDEGAAPSGGGSSVWPWLALGTGALASGAGVALYLLGARDHDAVTSAAGYQDPNGVDVMTEGEVRDLVDSGKQKKQLGVVGMGLGGALVATSVVLFLTRRGEPRAESAGLGIDAAASRRGAALSLKGAF